MEYVVDDEVNALLASVKAPMRISAYVLSKQKYGACVKNGIKKNK